jgi:hypothetical protein
MRRRPSALDAGRRALSEVEHKGVNRAGRSVNHGFTLPQARQTWQERSCALEGGLGLRDGHVHRLFLYRHDHVPVLVVAEYLCAGSLEASQGFGGGMAVGVVRAALDDGYLRGEAAEEERGRGCARAVVGGFQNREGSKLQNGPVTSYPSSVGRISRRSLW